ncbi:MAG: undecaprenyl diphosphate synthase family protein [Acidilobaceae archaeon]
MHTNRLSHVGIIPDGNRRWANSTGLGLEYAYDKGYEVLKNAIRWFIDYDVKYVTVYAMSRDNCTRRSDYEKRILFKLIDKALWDFRSDYTLKKYDISIRVVGDLSLIPDKLRASIKSLVEETKDRSDYIITTGLCYSFYWEFENYLAKGLKAPSQNLPPIDLVIRTGGMRRVSSFFPLLIEYAELYFTDTLWPNFTRRELEEAITWFYNQRRNFGV